MVRIIGIDGLDKNILDKHIDNLPNFKKIYDKGVLSQISSVFPADSVPAWTTIFTGLNPAEHGIIRGKDYIESIESFQLHSGFNLQGQTFWDTLSDLNFKCLIINPFLAYPAWKITGIMESGPAFITGNLSIFPKETKTLYSKVIGGYSAISNLAGLKAGMESVFSDTDKLWKEYEFQAGKEVFDLEFVTFTTLDRLQHYTWRFYDENDPLHEHDDYFSNCIYNLIKLFDNKIGSILSRMTEKDILIIISDHGFTRRPFSLINLNEYLRRKDLLIIKQEYNNQSIKRSQSLKNKVIHLLSRLKLLNLTARFLKRIKYFNKLKKSDYLIDKDNSKCYVDELFSGKKPYCGLNFGNTIRNSDEKVKEKVFEQICSALNSNEIPIPVWIKRAGDVYKGPFQSKLPDICVEFPPENGVEFNYFGEIMEDSSTHNRISGGHFGSGTFGYFSKNEVINKSPTSIIDFADFIRSLFHEDTSRK